MMKHINLLKKQQKQILLMTKHFIEKAKLKKV